MNKYLLFAFVLLLAACSDDDSKPSTNVIAPPPGAKVEIDIPMTLVPAGTFRMGDIHYDGKRYACGIPVHQVTISRPFYMSTTEITIWQWRTVTIPNFEGLAERKNDVALRKAKIVGSWYDAVDFCNQLSLAEGLAPCYSGTRLDIECDWEASGYRLPTEAEWEYACRAGTETDYCFGNITVTWDEPEPLLNKFAWNWFNAYGEVQTVGTRQPNAFGLYDMHGNVAEWCWDAYAPGYYERSPAVDPRGASKEKAMEWLTLEGNAPDIRRVPRGGSSDCATVCTSWFRTDYNPEWCYFTTGLRIVRRAD